VRDTLEDPDSFYSTTVRRQVWKQVDGILIMVQYDDVPDGKIKFNTAHPVSHERKKAMRND